MAPLKDKRVVVIGEDDVAIANLMRDALNDEPDINAVVVGDGALVLQTLRQVKADLLILDNMMPGMRGTEVYEQLRSDSALDRLPVLFVTAQGSLRVFEELGATDVIAKPFDLNDLLDRVRSMLAARRVAQ